MKVPDEFKVEKFKIDLIVWKFVSKEVGKNDN